MKKVSAEARREVFSEVPVVLRKLAAERDFYRERLSRIEERARVEKVAGQMIDKGLETGDVVALADRLERQVRGGEIDLGRLGDAVELVGPDMGKTAKVAGDDLYAAGAGTEFERFILS
jgi:hypothetical protein